jgi:hypothetical protein
MAVISCSDDEMVNCPVCGDCQVANYPPRFNGMAVHTAFHQTKGYGDLSILGRMEDEAVENAPGS